MPGLMTITVAQSGPQRVLGDAIGVEADLSRLKTQLVFLFPPGIFSGKRGTEGALNPGSTVSRIASIRSHAPPRAAPKASRPSHSQRREHERALEVALVASWRIGFLSGFFRTRDIRRSNM